MGPLPSDEFVHGKQQTGWTRGRWYEVKYESRVHCVCSQGGWAGKAGVLRSQSMLMSSVQTFWA